MTTIVHISDLHFGRENLQVIEPLLQSLAAIQPELVIISGDITQRARTREYLAAREFLKRLQWPSLIIPGNHDMSAHNLIERLCYPWRKWYRYIGDDLEPVMSINRSIVIGVNTTRRFSSFFDLSRGRISLHQVQNLRQLLTGDNSSVLRIIIAHHPFWLPEAYRHRHIIHGRDMAIQELAEAGVDMIFSGHVHFAYTHVLKGIIISHAGTAISRRLVSESPNSFKVMRGNSRLIDIETSTWNGDTFLSSGRELFRPCEAGWTRVS